MLVLSRKRDGKLLIGDDITITVVEISGDKVLLGVDAPSDVPVHRKEVYDAIKRDGQIKPLPGARVLANPCDDEQESEPDKFDPEHDETGNPIA